MLTPGAATLATDTGITPVPLGSIEMAGLLWIRWFLVVLEPAGFVRVVGCFGLLLRSVLGTLLLA